MASCTRLLPGALLALAVGSAPAVAQDNQAAQPYPTKAIRLVVPFPPGGPVDILARVLADRMAPDLGQPIVIENRGGAGGVNGTAMVAKAEPDGHTFALASAGALAVSVSLLERMPYDPLKDLALLTLVAVTPELLVVGPRVDAVSAAELIGLAKARPGKLNYASAGKGTMSHLTAEMFRLAAGIDIVHVPYSGAAPAINDLLGGHVQIFFADIQGLLGTVQSGQLRALAVSSRARSAVLPAVPTTAEIGLPEVEATNWYGAVAPPATPPVIVERLNSAIVAALRSSEAKAKLGPLGAELVGNSPAQFHAFVRAESDKWARVIRAASVRPN